MGYYVSTITGQYYEGDKASPDDIETITQRPSLQHDWVNGAWAVNPAKESQEKQRALTEARTLRENILARLNGLHIDALYANDIPPVISAIMVAKQALKDITIHPAVVSATDYDTTKIAILTRYYEIAAALGTDAPTAVSAFTGLDQ